MNIAIVGTGYVGLVTGTCFANMGNMVYCVDVDEKKINNLKNGIIPIYEPGLEEMIKNNKDRLHFATSLSSVIDKVDIVFSCVGTPPDENGSADLKYVLAVAREFGANIKKYTLFVTKSTVPVGTAELVRQEIKKVMQFRSDIKADIPFDVASNPEFLKEGNALKDFMQPERVVVGVDSPKAEEMMRELYSPFMILNDRIIVTNIPSAETIKYGANSMLATRISFMNELANYCEKVGANINDVRRGMGSDSRIGEKFLYAGCGYGGSCFPKDVLALLKSGNEHGCDMRVIKAVIEANEAQKHVLTEKLIKLFGEDFSGLKIAIWGLSFKPETDDMREATSLVLINDLKSHGIKNENIRVYDPIAMNECKRRIGDTVFYAHDMYEAAMGADAVVLVTEWKEFRMPDMDMLEALMHKPVTIIDGRNIYQKRFMESKNVRYNGIGV